MENILHKEVEDKKKTQRDHKVILYFMETFQFFIQFFECKFY